MDAKFCLKGNASSYAEYADFCWPEFAGNFPAEEPDPDGNLDIPIDFLVWTICCVIPFLSNLTLVCYLQASNGNPAAQQVINIAMFGANDATMLNERLFTLILASDTLYLIWW